MDDGLLQAILLDPENDVPRLIAADWLDEHAGTDTIECRTCKGAGWHGPVRKKRPGGFCCVTCGGDKIEQVPNGLAERAEFIRCQCELARIEKHLEYETPDVVEAFGPTMEKLLASGRELVSAALNAIALPGLMPYQSGVSRGWRREGYPGNPHAYIEAVFRRGFVSQVRCTSTDWQQPRRRIRDRRGSDYDGPTIGQEILRREPVERVELTDCDRTLKFRVFEPQRAGIWEMWLDPGEPYPARFKSRSDLIDAMPRQLRQWRVGDDERLMQSMRGVSGYGFPTLAART